MTIAEELGSTFLFEHLSPEQLAWLVERGQEERHPRGTVLFVEGAPATDLWIILDGQVQLSKRIEGEDVVLVTSEQRGAYLGAIRAFVRASGEETYGTTARLLRACRLFRIPAPVFTELLEDHFPIALHLLDGLFLGVRGLEAAVRQRENLVALGALSAGLAHELNNPAAAGRRAADGLRDTVAALQEGLGRLAEAGVTPQVLGDLAALAREAVDARAQAPELDGLEAGDREDELSDWLDRHGVAEPWELAPTLADAGLDTAFAQRLADAVGPDALEPAVRWISDSLSAEALAESLQDAAGRISTLVGAVKDYTYMDKTSEREIDVHSGLESTLTMLGHKLTSGITVERQYDRSLPPIRAYGGELNQVWTNLLDNAIHALDGHGTLRITTSRDGDHLVVEIADDGPGIPPAAQPRIFEPFFTTKEVGQGTGLGLDITYRIVTGRHRGRLTFTSVPGDTRFCVRLPLTPA